MYKILLVDDSKTMLYTFEYLLEENFENVENVKANDALEAIQILKEQTFDIIISDVYMPKMDGFEFAKYLAKNEHTSGIPLILTSAVKKEEADKIVSFQTGAIDFLEKPINETLFVAKLKVFFKLISTQRKLKQAVELESRQNAMKEMLSMIAHQWRQPLSSLGTSLSTMRLKKTIGKMDDDYFEKAIDSMERVVQDLSGKIRDFQNSFDTSKEEREEDLVALIEKAWELQRGRAQSLNVEFFLDKPNEKISKVLSKELFNQVMLNLLTNTLDAFEENTINEKKIFRVSIKKQSEIIEISIEDNAGGIKEKSIKKIFEPYFSTKSKNERGMGLYMAKNIVENIFKGEIKATNLHKGALFKIAI